MNRNNNRHQPSPLKHIIHPAAVPGTDGHDQKRQSWKTGPRCGIFHNYYQDLHYITECTIKFLEYKTVILNYEKLNADGKASVPVTSCYYSRRLITPKMNRKLRLTSRKPN